MEICKATTTPNTMWSFCPSLAPSILFICLFALTLIAHVGQAVYYRKPYSWIIIMSALWQVLTYIFRTLSIQNPASYSSYVAWFVLILVAPLWTNAYVYTVFGRMVWGYTATHKLWRIKAWQFGLIFIILDIVAFVVQVVGAAQAAGSNTTDQQVLNGLHIYMGGVGLQFAFILIFCVYALQFFFETRQSPSARQAFILFYAQILVLAMIVLRIIFRICEYSQGLDSKIPDHEAYQYCLDSLPMFIALVVYNVVHPGRIMRGKSGDMPSVWELRKQKRRGINSMDTSLVPQADSTLKA
ncbi:RTA1 like domain-containing protein [Trichoderma austrokoningii]